MNKRKIYFRADAGTEIGYGHFIRSLALVDMLKNDFDCTFYTVTPTEYQVSEMEKVCQYKAMNTNTALNDFLDILSGDETVVLDNYFYTTDYQKLIKNKGCKLVCIDDMHNKHYYADVIINMSPIKSIIYDKETYTQICLGFDWLLLRKEFLMPKTINKRNSDIVICLGGSDPYKITNKIIGSLILSDINEKIHVIVGDKVFINNNYRKNVEIHKDLTALEISKLFDKSGLAILSCSTVSIEAMSRGIPIIAGYYVDNQIEFYNYAKANKLFMGIDNMLEYDFSNIVNEIKNIFLSSEIFDIAGIKGRYINLFKKITDD